MNKILRRTLSILWFSGILPLALFGQEFNPPDTILHGCHINANERNWAAPYQNVKIATVKVQFDGGGRCTGTLVNQTNAYNEKRQILILSRHCIADDMGLGDIKVNFNSTNHLIYFHYQSPDGINNSTPLNNRGHRRVPSSLVATASRGGIVDTGYRFILPTSLKNLADNKWGDYAVLEIEEPIPPHFNPFFAGYSPVQPWAVSAFAPFVGFHHPRGSIKKLSKHPSLISYDPQTRVCHLVTRIVDFLFGWIWGRRSSTRRVCRYISRPYYAAIRDDGGTDEGSSGSGLFNSLYQHVGPLTGGNLGGCSGGVSHYTRNSDHFFDTKIRNYLNPARSIQVDNFGYFGTYMDCYPNLNLNGYYWPHSEHNQNAVNFVPITSNGEVNLARNDDGDNEVQWIVNGSDYTITAGSGFFTRANPLNGGFNQNDNFFAARGSNLSLKISPQPCNRAEKRYKADENDAYIWQEMQRTQNITLPPFGFNKLAERAKAHINIYPNPAAAKVKAQWSSSLKVSELRVVSVGGKVLQTMNTSSNNRIEIDLSNYSNGLYFVQFFNQGQLISAEKIQVQH